MAASNKSKPKPTYARLARVIVNQLQTPIGILRDVTNTEKEITRPVLSFLSQNEEYKGQQSNVRHSINLFKFE